MGNKSTSKKWDKRDDKELKQIVDTCPVSYLDEISKAFYKRRAKIFSLKEISLRLRKTLGYSRKVVLYMRKQHSK
jgi:hypothetical protein